MKLITVIPFLKSLQKETLTYFSAKKISVGDIVDISVRNKAVEGLVVNVENIDYKKNDIKKSLIKFKKIEGIKGKSVFLNSFLKTSQNIKDYFVASAGQILNNFVPNIFFSNYEQILKEKGGKRQFKNPKESIYAIQMPTEERIDFYKKHIEGLFKQKKSVFFCFPTIIDAKNFYEKIREKVGDSALLMHTKLTKKEFIKTYNKIILDDNPVAIFGTHSFLFLPRKDFGEFIIEKESSNLYIFKQKPYIDTRIFVENLALEQKVDLIFADSILRTETFWRIKNKEILKKEPFKWINGGDIKEEIVDMRKEKNKDFQIISKEVREEIKKNIKDQENMILFGLRGGYATTTICNDCGTAVLKDGKPLILFENKNTGERFFKDYNNKKYDANIVCSNCQSWNLKALGIGTEKIYEEVSKIIPKEKIFVLDKTSAKTEKMANLIIKEFEKSEGSVLIGTEIMLFYLTKKVNSFIIVSFDTLFNLPNYNIYEKILSLVTTIYSLTKEKLILQTRYSDEKIIEHMESKNITEFYKGDIQNREIYKYPPFYTLIKVIHESSSKEINSIALDFKKIYEKYSPSISVVNTGQNKARIIMLIKIEKNRWTPDNFFRKTNQDKDLFKKLSSLPPYYNIKINPETIL